MLGIVIMLFKIILIDFGGRAALEKGERRENEGIRDSQPSDSPCNLENMPRGLAVITLAQREARPQPIWWGGTAFAAFAPFPLFSQIDPVPQRGHQRHNREKKRGKERVYNNNNNNNKTLGGATTTQSV